ncbi:polyprenyl synthetase family protein [Candidatus Collierbacteria bacterium]|nr:polyprenyl synthetase family protein [Candidatus Collierbacteria bacterium]
MQALAQLASFKTEFEKGLGELLQVEGAKAMRIDPQYAIFIKILEEFTMRGGKRIRPAFMYFSYLACGGEDKAEIMKAARSVELLQTFLLMHDDLVDRSDLRRGKPTTHRMFEKEFEKLNLLGNREHFGQSTAMICGDIAHMLAYNSLMETNFPFERREKARKLFDRIMFDTAYGWYREMLNTMKPDVVEDEVLRAMEYVSARYTIAGPVGLGAILSGTNEKNLKILTEYGLRLGTAFQIQDDILGMFGDEKEVGKPVNSDLLEGKKTLLYIGALEKLREKNDVNGEKKFLGIYGKSDKLVDLNWVRDLMRDEGVLQNTKEKARKLAESALSELAKGRFVGEGKEFLEGIAEYIVTRKV